MCRARLLGILRWTGFFSCPPRTPSLRADRLCVRDTRRLKKEGMLPGNWVITVDFLDEDEF